MNSSLWDKFFHELYAWMSRASDAILAVASYRQ